MKTPFPSHNARHWASILPRHVSASLLAIGTFGPLPYAYGLDLTEVTPFPIAGNTLQFEALSSQNNLTRVTVRFYDETSKTWLPEEPMALSSSNAKKWLLDRTIRLPGDRKAQAFGYRNGSYQGCSGIITFYVAPAQKISPPLQTVLDDTGIWIYPTHAATLGESIIGSVNDVVVTRVEVANSGPCKIPNTAIQGGYQNVDLRWYDAQGSLKGTAVWSTGDSQDDVLVGSTGQILTVGNSTLLVSIASAINATWPDASLTRGLVNSLPEGERSSFMGRMFSILASAENNFAGFDQKVPRLKGGVRTLEIPQSIVSALNIGDNASSRIFLPLAQRMSDAVHGDLHLKVGEALRQAIRDAGGVFSVKNGVETLEIPPSSLDTMRGVLARKLREIYTSGIRTAYGIYLKGQQDSLALATSSIRPNLMRYGSAFGNLFRRVIAPNWPTATDYQQIAFFSRADEILNGSNGVRIWVGKRLQNILAKFPGYIANASIIGNNVYRRVTALIPPEHLATLRSLGKYVPAAVVGSVAYSALSRYEETYASSTDRLMIDSTAIWSKGEYYLVESGIPLESLSAQEKQQFDVRVIACLADQEAKAYSTASVAAVVTTGIISTGAGATAAAGMVLASEGTAAPAAPYVAATVSAGISFVIENKIEGAANGITRFALERSLDWRIDKCAQSIMTDGLHPILETQPTEPPKVIDYGVSVVPAPGRISYINSGANSLQVNITTVPKAIN